MLVTIVLSARARTTGLHLPVFSQQLLGVGDTLSCSVTIDSDIRSTYEIFEMEQTLRLMLFDQPYKSINEIVILFPPDSFVAPSLWISYTSLVY
jgi:hypothetical protein